MPSSPTSPPELIPSSWNPLVICLVGIVCTIFLLFSYYTILKRHCCSFRGITFSRNPVQRRLLNEANTDDPSQQFQSRGLESYLMHSLPITQFKNKNDEEMTQSSAECAVCLGEFEDGEWLKHLPNCTHIFHVACIDTWFQTHSNCPLCRSYVHDLTLDHEYSVSMYSLLETLRREDFFQDRAAHYQILRSEILQNSALRYGTAHAS